MLGLKLIHVSKRSPWNNDNIMLAHWPFGNCCNSECVIFKQIFDGSYLNISCEIACRWMPHHATSHHLNQCWPSLLTPYSITGAHELKLQECNGKCSGLNGFYQYKFKRYCLDVILKDKWPFEHYVEPSTLAELNVSTEIYLPEFHIF